MKTIKKAYKFRFYPQDDLKVILAKTFGCARFVFNKSLDYSELNYKAKFLDNEKTIINPSIKNTSIINRQLKNSSQPDFL